MKKLNTLLRKEVSILGASGTFGRLTSLLLKRSPEVSVLRLHDDSGLDPSKDLNLINTKCLVKFYTGNDGIHEAIKSADVIVIGDETTKELNMQNSFLRKAQKIMEYAINIATYNPGAVVVVASSPVNSTLPLVSKVMEALGKLNPDKVLGMTNVENIRASSLLAQHLCIAPDSAWVPVVGGSTQETRVPLYSKARPLMKPSLSLLQRLTCEVKTNDLQVYRTKGEHELTNRAHATAQLVKSVLKGLGGMDVIETVFSRQEHVRGVDYFSLPVLLGEDGIRKRIALPAITDYEERLIKHSVKLLAVDATKALEYVKANLNADEVKGNRRLTKIIERNKPLEVEGNLQTPDRPTTKRIKRRNIYEEHLAEKALNESIASDITEQLNSVQEKPAVFTTKEKVLPNISENDTLISVKPKGESENIVIPPNDQNISPTGFKEFGNNVAKLLLKTLNPVESPAPSQSNDKTTKSLVKVCETKIKSLMPIKTENQNEVPAKKVLGSEIPLSQLYRETNKNTSEINNVNSNKSRTKKFIQSGRIPPPFAERREYTNISKTNGEPPHVVRDRSDQINKELLPDESLRKQTCHETRIGIDEKLKSSLKIVESGSCVVIENSPTIKPEVVMPDTAGVKGESKENITLNNTLMKAEVISTNNRIMKNENKESNVKDETSNIVENRFKSLDLSSNINLIKSKDVNRPSSGAEISETLYITKVEPNSENEHSFDVSEVKSKFLERLQALFKSENSSLQSSEDNFSAFDCYDDSTCNSILSQYLFPNETLNFQVFSNNIGNRQMLKRVCYFPIVEFSRFTSSETVNKTDESETDAAANRRKQNLRAEEVRNFFQEKRKQYAKDNGYRNAQSNIPKKYSILKANIKLVKSSEDEKSLTKKLKERQRKLIMSLQLGNFEDYGEVPKSPSNAQIKMQNRKNKQGRKTVALGASGQVKEKNPSYIDRLSRGNGAKQSLTFEKCKKTETFSNSQDEAINTPSSSVTIEPHSSEQTNKSDSQLETGRTQQAAQTVVQTNCEMESISKQITVSPKSKVETSGQDATVNKKYGSKTGIDNSKEDALKSICTNKTLTKELTILETLPSQVVDAKAVNESDIIVENRSDTKIVSAESNLSKRETPPEKALTLVDRTTEKTQRKGHLNITAYAVKFEPRTINNVEETGYNSKEKIPSDAMVKLSMNNNKNDRVQIQENNKTIVNSERHVNQQLCTTVELNKNDNFQSNITINSIRNQSAFTAVENKQYTDYLMKSNFRHLTDIPENEIPVGRLETRKQPVKSKRPSALIRGTNNTPSVQSNSDIMYSTDETKTPQKRKNETSSIFHEKLARSAEKIASFSNSKKNQPSACLKSVKIIRHVEKLSK